MSDTSPIILAVVGTGVTLLGILAGLLLSLFRILRQDMRDMEGRLNVRIDTLDNRIDSMEEKVNGRIDSLRQEMRAEIAALNNRIDNLYQALFNHKDPAA